jgi:hypothetical protein
MAALLLKADIRAVQKPGRVSHAFRRAEQTPASQVSATAEAFAHSYRRWLREVSCSITAHRISAQA